MLYVDNYDQHVIGRTIESAKTYKVCDFGLSRVMANQKEEAQRMMTTHVGTASHMAPELLAGDQITLHSHQKAVDV